MTDVLPLLLVLSGGLIYALLAIRGLWVRVAALEEQAEAEQVIRRAEFDRVGSDVAEGFLLMNRRLQRLEDRNG
jgi:hypothetical protein